MIQTYYKNITLFILFISSIAMYAQETSSILIAESPDSFIQNLSENKTKGFSLKNSKSSSIILRTNVQQVNDDDITFIGTINNQKLSTFTIHKTKNKLEGNLILQDSKTGYQIFTNDHGKVYLKEADIDTLICVDLEKSSPETKTDASVVSSKMAPILESLPGAEGVIYLDFDGEVVSGTSWVSGGTINAASPNFSDQKIIAVWKIMAEDFRPFNLNVTTNRAIFDATPRNRRMMCIFTPTNDAAPGSGGVAYVNSFSRNNDNPCWVYNLSTRAAGETGSHEIGHTLGLYHDGQGGTEYYSGHGQWSPIMGWSANKPIGHWSSGEYNNATSSQDDIAIIANNTNGVGFQNDDHGDTIGDATSILVDNDGNVSASQNFGLISQRTDKDVFSFVIETGNVSFDFSPDPDYPNLNIQARILNAIGEEVAFSDPSGLSASINTQLTDGTYFIEIDGVGEGSDFSNGYSDYSSLGNYTISGQYIPGDNNQPPVANFEATIDCAIASFTNTSINTVDTYLWDFGDGNTSTEQNPTHDYQSSGVYTVSLTTTNSVGQNTNEKNNFVDINLPSQPIAANQNLCTGESTTITMSGSSQYQWYDAPTGGNLITTGSTYETPVLTATQTYYVAGAFDGCVTDTRTAVSAIVADNPEQPVISVPDNQNLTIDSEYASYQWYFNDEPIADTNQAQYLPDQVGTYRVEVFNETGCNTISEEFSVDLSQLNSSQGTSIFKYYPNPTKDILRIDGLTINEKDIRIVNASGQIIIESIITPEVDLSSLSNGLYIILINNESVGKFVKL
ncbi:Ig-like domain-containing protein [Aquimarina sp. 2201CG14-23]|uniref:Ig-like domain-containing protein n=1 Tax=Aquimarina mycalae TaxID=3040073 RepID=UPI002477FD0B|nr:PKD domain-containing protein [Aquimarina sp. 2201CG14-23]MDH7448320.1 PKD domain-containing protein [Aquimarina sp. 2201CG14-23]